jgi:hypothetical protein
MARALDNPLSKKGKTILVVGALVAAGVGAYFLLSKKAAAGQPTALSAGKTYKITYPTSSLGGDVASAETALKGFLDPGVFQVLAVDASADGSTITVTVKMLQDGTSSADVQQVA